MVIIDTVDEGTVEWDAPASEVLANGVLLIHATEDGSQPIAGYAPGSWITFEIRGD